MSTSAAVGASVDLGSNSVHLLVAAIDRYDLRPLADMSAFLGLGAAVDDQAHLGAAKRGELVATLVDYAATARTHGAERITFMGTEPIRRAADGARIVAAVERASGVPLYVLTHEEEGYLTMIGVTGGRPVIHETLVVDIGGGSSEFCAVAPGRRARAAGLRLGSNRLSARFARTDPVTREAFDAMVEGADEIVASALPSDPSDLFLVGGTASNLLKVTEGGSADRVLTSARLSEGIRTVLSQPAATLTERYLVNPKRGPLLAAGAAIVDALMRRYVVDRVRVSEAGMREGAVLVAAHAGRAWRDRLPDLAHGWRR